MVHSRTGRWSADAERGRGRQLRRCPAGAVGSVPGQGMVPQVGPGTVAVARRRPAATCYNIHCSAPFCVCTVQGVQLAVGGSAACVLAYLVGGQEQGATPLQTAWFVVMPTVEPRRVPALLVCLCVCLCVSKGWVMPRVRTSLEGRNRVRSAVPHAEPRHTMSHLEYESIHPGALFKMRFMVDSSGQDSVSSQRLGVVVTLTHACASAPARSAPDGS